MNPLLAGELGVERSRHDVVASHHYRLLAHCCQHLNIGPDFLHNRSADEYRVNRLGQARHVELGFEGFQLAPKGVALHDDVEQPELDLSRACRGVGEEDHSGARPQRRETGANGLPERFHQSKAFRQFPDRGRFATGDDQAIQPFELFGPSHHHGFESHRRDEFSVLAKISLQGQDS